jgi:hypothetical protein
MAPSTIYRNARRLCFLQYRAEAVRHYRGKDDDIHLTLNKGANRPDLQLLFPVSVIKNKLNTGLVSRFLY